MKVNNVNSAEIYKAYSASSPEQATHTKNESTRKAQGATSAVQDKVNISSRVQQMREIDKAVSASPDIRKDKVSEIEQKIRNGTYKADYNAIADKLLNPDLNARI